MNHVAPLSLDDFNAYISLLASHDWYYDYSDDHSVWTRGKNRYEALQRQAKTHPFYQQAKNIWSGYIYRGANGKEADAKALRDAGIEALRAQCMPAAVAATI